MSHLTDLLAVQPASHIQRATVSVVDDIEGIAVRLHCVSADTPVCDLPCQVLAAGGSGAVLACGDEVLVWAPPGTGLGVVLGRVGPYAGEGVQRSTAIESPRVRRLVLEAEDEVVLRNRHARLRLGADGEVELSCAGFTTRSRRLLSLLAPMIKLN
jgi:hypothetical protein